MLHVAQPHAGQGLPPTAGDSNGSRRPRGPDGWGARALLIGAGGLYFAGAELTPFDRVDLWIDARFFWEPIALAIVALLVVLVVASDRERRHLADRLDATRAPVLGELVPICTGCKAVLEEDGSWEPIEAYLAQRAPDKFTRSLCPTCLERLAS